MATGSNDDVCTSQPEDRRILNDSSPFIPKYQYTDMKRLQRIIGLERDLFLETSKRLALAYNDAHRSESRLRGRGSPERRARLLSENAMKDSSQEATDTSIDILHPMEGVIELPVNFQDLSFRRVSHPGLDYHNSSGIVQFYFVNSQDADHFLSSAAFPTIKFSYLTDYAVRIKMPLLPHGTATDTIDTLIKQSAATMNHMMTVRGFNNTNIPALNGCGSKQADQAWGTYDPPVGARKDRPSIVLEVGLSESQDELLKDVKFWLDPQRGGVAMVLTCKIDRNLPMITLEMWERSGRRLRMTDFILMSPSPRNPDTIDFTQNSLTIPFFALFHRNPNPGEHDIVLDQVGLEHLARRVWEDQEFELLGGRRR